MGPHRRCTRPPYDSHAFQETSRTFLTRILHASGYPQATVSASDSMVTFVGTSAISGRICVKRDICDCPLNCLMPRQKRLGLRCRDCRRSVKAEGERDRDQRECRMLVLQDQGPYLFLRYYSSGASS